jgi:uncharacterized protein YeaO (DUF488 family)
MPVNIRRAYEKPGPRDGIRVLVDGLWPRGVSKSDLMIAIWEKSIAPSKALREWYGHDPEKWSEFRKRYRQELEKSPRREALDQLVLLAGQGNLTLVFGASDAEHSNATVLAEVIRERLNGAKAQPAKTTRRKNKAKPSP